MTKFKLLSIVNICMTNTTLHLFKQNYKLNIEKKSYDVTYAT